VARHVMDISRWLAAVNSLVAAEKTSEESIWGAWKWAAGSMMPKGKKKARILLLPLHCTASTKTHDSSLFPTTSQPLLCVQCHRENEETWRDCMQVLHSAAINSGTHCHVSRVVVYSLHLKKKNNKPEFPCPMFDRPSYLKKLWKKN
jgi:hypothetical protein